MSKNGNIYNSNDIKKKYHDSFFPIFERRAKTQINHCSMPCTSPKTLR